MVVVRVGSEMVVASVVVLSSVVVVGATVVVAVAGASVVVVGSSVVVVVEASVVVQCVQTFWSDYLNLLFLETSRLYSLNALWSQLWLFQSW